MADDDETLLEVFRKLTAAYPDRDHTIVLNAVEEFEGRKLKSLLIGDAGRGAVRPVRFAIFGLLQGVPSVDRCSCSDLPGEEEESAHVLEMTARRLPEGRMADPETIAKVIASDLRTIAMLAIFKDEAGGWIRWIFHHPLLAKEEAFRLVREFGDETPSFGPS